MARLGAPLKLNAELQERLLSYLRKGNYVETAAACAGIHKDTFYEWMKRGAKGEEPYASFAEAVHAALAEGEAQDLERIGNAASEQWQAAAWRLERRHPERWSRNDRVKVEAKIDVSDDELASKLARLIAAGATAPGTGGPESGGTGTR